MMNEVKLYREIILNTTYEQAHTLQMHISLGLDVTKYALSILNTAIANNQYMELNYLPKIGGTNVLTDWISPKILNDGNLVSNMLITLVMEHTIPLFKPMDINDQNIRTLIENIEILQSDNKITLVGIGSKVWNDGVLISRKYSKYVKCTPLHEHCGVCFNIHNEHGDYINITKDITAQYNSFDISMLNGNYKVMMKDYTEEEALSNLLTIMTDYMKNIDINNIKHVPLSVYLASNPGIIVVDKLIKGYTYDENTKQVYRIIHDGSEEKTSHISGNINIINKFDKSNVRCKSVVYIDCNNENRYIVLTELNNKLVVEVYTK